MTEYKKVQLTATRLYCNMTGDSDCSYVCLRVDELGHHTDTIESNKNINTIESDKQEQKNYFKNKTYNMSNKNDDLNTTVSSDTTDISVSDYLVKSHKTPHKHHHKHRKHSQHKNSINNNNNLIMSNNPTQSPMMMNYPYQNPNQFIPIQPYPFYQTNNSPMFEQQQQKQPIPSSLESLAYKGTEDENEEDDEEEEPVLPTQLNYEKIQNDLGNQQNILSSHEDLWQADIKKYNNMFNNNLQILDIVNSSVNYLQQQPQLSQDDNSLYILNQQILSVVMKQQSDINDFISSYNMERENLLKQCHSFIDQIKTSSNGDLNGKEIPKVVVKYENKLKEKEESDFQPLSYYQLFLKEMKQKLL